MSRFIRVAVDAGVSNATNAKTLVPFGFRAMNAPIPLMSGSLNLNATSYATSQVPTSSSYYSNNYFGFDFTNLNNLNYLAPVPTTGFNTGSNSDFYLGNVSQDAAAAFPTATPYSGSLETALTAGTFTTNVALSTRKFIVGFQGGFDGTRPNLAKFSGENITAANTFGFDCSGTGKSGTTSYNKAFALLANTDYYDMNMLITPGIIDSLHSVVTSAARNLCETRQDTFYVMDLNELTDSVSQVVAQATTLDSNYTSTYWPWVRILNPAKNVPLWVPPSVVVPGVLAFNDAVAAPWYAPAGLTRGGLTSVSDTYMNLSQTMRDSLYEARVNPIANFPNEGQVIWGQKTLQARPSALDRVNVRRLLITVKKFIASSTRYLVFEQNTDATRLRFLSIVNPYLDQVKAKQGIYQFKVIMDQSNNTADMIDQNILYGQILIQPTRTAEFIILDFNIQPTGASFPE
jgi:phage tail sheath protein FI